MIAADAPSATHAPHAMPTERPASLPLRIQGLRWHVRVQGSGPALLLLHGTGASGRSWQALVAPLAKRHTLIVPDLPGHGDTRADDARALKELSSIDGMASALMQLLVALGHGPGPEAGLLRSQAASPAQDHPSRHQGTPLAIIGHSAGAAVAARMILSMGDDHVDRPGLISLNGALLPLRGPAAALMRPIARLMAATDLVPRLLALRAKDDRALRRIVASTGSTLDANGVEHYRRLLGDPAHVAGVLRMMANWDLNALQTQLHRLGERVLLVSTEGDRTVPPAYARRVARALPRARTRVLPALGHLAHEEAPERFADIILEQVSEWAPPTPR